MTKPEHKLRWYQYKLSSLFVLTILVALASGWCLVQRQKAAKRRAAMTEIEKAAEKAVAWDFNGTLTDWCFGSDPTYAPLGRTQITDAGLIHLKDLPKLRRLVLDGTQITDAGLVHIKGLTKLHTLQLNGTEITDAGLVHLKGLTNIGYLDLRDTQVTDEGVKKLQEALPNCEIFHEWPEEMGE